MWSEYSAYSSLVERLKKEPPKLRCSVFIAGDIENAEQKAQLTTPTWSLNAEIEWEKRMKRQCE